MNDIEEAAALLCRLSGCQIAAVIGYMRGLLDSIHTVGDGPGGSFEGVAVNMIADSLVNVDMIAGELAKSIKATHKAGK